jgi:putative Mg2+ transporter-C (MgtC) family protein
MDWENEALMAAQALGAAVLGGLVGSEREQGGRAAGIRTYATVCLGACVFSLVSTHLPGIADQGRISAQVVSGIGFIGAGVIMREQGRVIGLTTAATLWATAAIGVAIAYKMYVLGVLTAVIIFGLLALNRFPGWSRLTSSKEQPPKQD